MSNYSAIENYAGDLPPDSFPEMEPVEMPRILKWGLMVAGLAGFGYFAYEGDFILATLAGVASLAAISGFRMGVSRLFASLLGFWAAYRLAPGIGTKYEYQFSQVFDTSGLANRFLAVAVVAVLVSMIVFFLSCKVIGWFMKNRRTMTIADSYLGSLVGVAQSGLCALLLLGGVVFLAPTMEKNSEQDETPATTDWTINLAKNTHESRVGPIVEQYNPFTNIETLGKIGRTQETVRVLTNPDNLQRLVEHPEIVALQEDPEFELALKNLNEDPEIRDILKSGKPIGKAEAWQLLSHPAVKDLVDQKDFLKRATEVVMNQVDSLEQAGQIPIEGTR